MSADVHVLQGTATAVDADARLFRKITIRLIPLLWLVYFFNYLDRTNVAYAQLRMKDDLGFGDTVFGLGASLIFFGLIAFEIPSNMILARIGLRKTLTRILVLWGLCSAAMSLVTTPAAFYALRFLTGMFEAGLVPGVLYYLSLWYPSQRRGQPSAIFYTAPSCAGIVSGPLAGVFMTYLNGAASFQGWQWLFVAEGLPCLVLAVVVFKILSDTPEQAEWLTPGERQRVQSLIRESNVSHGVPTHRDTLAMLRLPRLWVLGIVGFLMLISLFGLTFWQPTLLKGQGLSVLEVGLFSAIPSLCGVVASVLIARHSDKTDERCWHYILCALTAAFGLLLTTRFPDNTPLTLLSLCVTWTGLTSAYAMLWTLPGRVFSGRLAATGLAIITVIHGSAGIVGPSTFAYLKVATGGFTVSLYLGSALLIASILLFYPFFSRERGA